MSNGDKQRRNWGRSRQAKRVLWAMLGLIAASAVWALNVEITYERNVHHLPASFELRRHVITRLWRT